MIDNMRTLKIFSILLIISIALCMFFIGKDKKGRMVFEGKTYGTYYKIIINSPKQNPELDNDIKQILKMIDNQMSVFNPHSEISRINQTAADKKIKLSAPMQNLMKKINEVYQKSNHAFDPTVGPLVEIWGFGTQQTKEKPTPEKISKILEYTGFNKLAFSPNFDTLQKQDSRVNLNLSAIAKGYAVDSVANFLELHDYHDYLVDIGGEMRISGNRSPKETGWNVAIAAPLENKNENTLVLTLSNTAVATSGDYRNFTYYDGKKISHTISPQSGYPVEGDLASATVFYPHAAIADAYATAIMVLGAKEGLKMADTLDLQAILILRNPQNENFEIIYSQAARSLQKE